MKKIIALITLVVAVVCVFTASVSANVATTPVEENTVVGTTNVDGAVKARLLNMLNHNYIFGNDFMCERTIIENSILPLLDKAQDGEINKDVVLGFIANMYGLEVDQTAAEYDFLPASEGNFAIIPRGYSVITHTLVSVTKTDGGYTVVSTMNTESHDGEVYTDTVETVFAQNQSSAFGYNIVSCNIVTENTAA